MAEPAPPPKTNRSILHSIAFRNIAYQLLLAAALIFLGWYLYYNINENLDRQNIATGWSFLNEPAGFDISESIIPFDSSQTFARIFAAGVLNTLHVAFVGIFLATLLGVIMGIARVSRNWLVSKVASAYVEICRNVPVVLHVIFWSSIIRLLPHPRQALEPFNGAFISNRGLMLPFPVDNVLYPWVAFTLVLGIGGALIFARWARFRREHTGQYISIFWPSTSIVVGLPLLVWALGGAPLAWDYPELKGFNYQGGISLSPEYIALLIGITVYTGAFIAEIVRSGIESIHRGQIEASRALGLRHSFIMRYIIIPQALRVIVPPTASQYLSLTKNSSLGVLIGYPDLVNIGNTSLNQTGQAVEAIAIMMLVYLTISLTISIFMNFYNKLVAIRER